MPYNWFQKLGIAIFGIPIRTDVKYAVMEATNEKLSKSLASTKAQLGLANAEIKDLKDKINEPLKKSVVAKKLKESEEKIKKEDIGKIFWLGGLYRYLYGKKVSEGTSEFLLRSKYGKKFEFADRNDRNPFIFGDIGITSKGYFIIVDKDKNIRGQFLIPRGMFADVSSLMNQMRRGRLLMGTDEMGRYSHELEDLEINKPVWNDELQEYEETEFRKINAKKFIVELEERIRELEEIGEGHEMIIDSQKKDIRDRNRKIEKYKKESNINESDMSRMQIEYGEAMSKVSSMQAQILKLTEIAGMKEELAQRFEKAVYELLAKIEDVSGKTAKDKAMSEIKDLIDYKQSKEVAGGKIVVPAKVVK